VCQAGFIAQFSAKHHNLDKIKRQPATRRCVFSCNGNVASYRLRKETAEKKMPGIEDAPREIARPMSALPASGNMTLKKTHPAVIIAAGAVTIFCAVGVGVMTGIIPSARALNSPAASTASSAPSVLAAASGAAQAPLGQAVETAPATAPAPVLKPITKPDLGQPLSRGERAERVERDDRAARQTVPSYPSAQPGSSVERMPQVAAAPVPATIPAPAPVAICATCGTVESITPITTEGKGSGAGAVIGGVIGGALGRQVGGGRGKDAATVAGAVGGAILGNHIEKSNKATQHNEVRVRMEDGTTRTVRIEGESNWRSGDRVKVEDGRLVRN
jgi:outer membrane lipoprotein SlyB